MSILYDFCDATHLCVKYTPLLFNAPYEELSTLSVVTFCEFGVKKIWSQRATILYADYVAMSCYSARLQRNPITSVGLLNEQCVETYCHYTLCIRVVQQLLTLWSDAPNKVSIHKYKSLIFRSPRLRRTTDNIRDVMSVKSSQV